MKNNKTVFKINKTKWTCLFVSQHDETNSSIRGNMGLTRYSDRVILIDSDIKEPDLTATVIHEITHAFIWEYGFAQVTFADEIVCDFFGVYGKDIIKIADIIVANNKK